MRWKINNGEQMLHLPSNDSYWWQSTKTPWLSKQWAGRFRLVKDCPLPEVILNMKSELKLNHGRMEIRTEARCFVTLNIHTGIQYRRKVLHKHK